MHADCYYSQKTGKQVVVFDTEYLRECEERAAEEKRKAAAELARREERKAKRLFCECGCRRPIKDCDESPSGIGRNEVEFCLSGFASNSLRSDMLLNCYTKLPPEVRTLKSGVLALGWINYSVGKLMIWLEAQDLTMREVTS